MQINKQKNREWREDESLYLLTHYKTKEVHSISLYLSEDSAYNKKTKLG